MDDFDQIEQGLSDIERFAHNLLLESVSSTVVAGQRPLSPARSTRP
jgi:hypothetical protein